MKRYKFEKIVNSDSECIELGFELSKYLIKSFEVFKEKSIYLK